MITLDDLPLDVRRAMALRAALETLGFDDSMIHIGAGFTITGGPPPPGGQVLLAATLSLDGDELNPGFICIAGYVERAWWDGGGRDRMVAAWNALTPEERMAERQRHVPATMLYSLTTQLLTLGITPPAVAEATGVPGTTTTSEGN